MTNHKAKLRDLSETAGQVTQQHKGPLCLRARLLKRYHVYLSCNRLLLLEAGLCYQSRDTIRYQIVK